MTPSSPSVGRWPFPRSFRTGTVARARSPPRNASLDVPLADSNSTFFAELCMKLPWHNRNRLLPEKLELIDSAFSTLNIHSFADLGGVWGVEGGYTFHALDKHDVSRAIL